MAADGRIEGPQGSRDVQGVQADQARLAVEHLEHLQLYSSPGSRPYGDSPGSTHVT